ncbi:MAG: M14 family metallopeptidase [Flavobacteriia bacterium]|nr:M14 family metallopeptidase [Flavobacteriia bacterium]
MKHLLMICLSLFGSTLFAQQTVDLNYYLPQGVSYDTAIPTPQEVIGHQVGEWHVTHDKLVQYMTTLAAASDRISIENRGTTFEGRPLLLLTVTSPENHSNINRIQQEHLALTEGTNTSLSTQDMPIVVYQGFSIHGNEPSGANAGLAYAYYLAAAQGPEITSILENTIILMDPSFNPDGLQRFAYWANTNRAQLLNPDPNDREYHEVWPGGRTNHYWFDMNRDWLPVQLPESRARIKSFHAWKPNILTDHHEMGTNSTFFFQPGEPTRVHPLTPAINQELTAEIGSYHAKALDKIGSLYYSEENYDDYYYGKGSTFPDINGSIGILFEQGSSRGHIQESENGVLTFPFTIRNQFTTALSTIAAAQGMRSKILSYQRDFFSQARQTAAKEKQKAIVFGDSKDAAKTNALAEILHRQQIKFHSLKQDAVINGKSFKKGHGYVVPLNQQNNTLINAMFEKRTTFTDSLFYDISAWTFPLAFNLEYTTTNTTNNAGPEVKEIPVSKGNISGPSDYAYLFEWHEYFTPKALNMILEKGLRAKVAKRRFSLEGDSYDYGSIMIPVANQSMNSEEIHKLLTQVAQEAHISIKGVGTGLSQGIDLGSNNFEAINKASVAIVVGNGTASYDAGEIWHLFDQRYQMKLTKIDVDYFNRVDLSRYTTLIIPNMYGSALDKGATEKIKNWVKDGGNLIAYKNSAKWLERNEFMSLDFKEASLEAKNISYENRDRFYGAQQTGGAIFEAKLDLSHPVNYGYHNPYVAMFRKTNVYVTADEQSFNNPIQYTNQPLLSGYHSKVNATLIPKTVPFKVNGMGRGQVILFTDNTNFRAFWYGTNKFLANAIFFGNMM